MANATARVAKKTVRWTDEFFQRPLKTLSSETTYYTGAMIGLNVSGYLDKFDDAGSFIFAGLARGREGNPVMAAATQGDVGHDLDLHLPRYFEIALASVALTDIGKPVYASDDQTAVLDASTRTYANLIGHIVDRISATIALVEGNYAGVFGHQKLGASLFLAATGTITLAKWDLFKTIFIQNTAAQTINLPAVASCPAGSRLTFVKISSDAFAATLDGSGAETIDGAATLATLDADNDCATLVSTGSEWVVLNRDIT